MPPFIPQKRSQTLPPTQDEADRSPKRRKNEVDSHHQTRTVQDNQDFVNALDQISDQESLSDIDSEQFEDVSLHHSPQSEEDDDVDWENAIEPQEQTAATASKVRPAKDLEITLNDGGAATSLSNPFDKQKGPSKIERQIRSAIHCMHVQCLLFHNLARNGWATDKATQKLLVEQLPSSVRKEVERWRTASGLPPLNDGQDEQRPKRKDKRKSRQSRHDRNQRDWSKAAEWQNRAPPDMKRGDPIIRLLKVLAVYWKKRFRITLPCLRKQGHKTLPVIEEELRSWKQSPRNATSFGECISDVEDFRQKARAYEGSKDLGTQLFTALIRGLGIDARLVASLQPLGFGWNKGEEASVRSPAQYQKEGCVDQNSGTNSNDQLGAQTPSSTAKTAQHRSNAKEGSGKRQSARGSKNSPVSLDEDNLDDNHVNLTNQISTDDESIIDVTPNMPRRKPNSGHDRDMPAPTYWTEAISPITNEVYPVEPFTLTHPVATNPDSLAQFEARGAKADKAKQVFAYVVAYSADGTAKDVTTRYLKRHLWPGRTKGVRMSIEKVPIYNRKGKIKRYEQYDWTKRVIGAYGRHHSMRTAVDDNEDSNDLKPAKPPTKGTKVGEDTLQAYKSSAEFVLQRHLRREEAIRPGSESVKLFTIGKGENTTEEPVFLRKDVETCRTVESWHKEGRTIKAGEQPWKQVPVRAVTANRKREVEEVERDSGKKAMQGLYARHQTEWIIPEPIQDGIIPKNAYGNIDCFVATMVPKGAVHIPLRNTVKVCKKLSIDYAEACTGFEFGHRMAVPVIIGVVVAQEHEDAVIDEWERDEEERRIKEEGKREKLALAMWRKWILSLRVLRRIREEYGEHQISEEKNPFVNQKRRTIDLSNAQTNGHDPLLSESEHSDNLTGASDRIPDQQIGEGTAGGFFIDEEEDHPHGNGELTVKTYNSGGDSDLGTPSSRPAHGRHRLTATMKTATRSPGGPGSVLATQNGRSGRKMTSKNGLDAAISPRANPQSRNDERDRDTRRSSRLARK